jgi:transposase
VFVDAQAAATRGRRCSDGDDSNRYLRQLLVVGAMAVIRYAERHGTRRPWLVQLMTARMVWALMTSGERYREPVIA